MSEPLFVPANFFIIRTPLFPFELAHPFLNSPIWRDHLFNLFKTDATFREAISIASSSLYEAIKKDSIHEIEKTATSLLYYLIRSATRATPFGFFSFVATGRWNENTNIDFRPANLQKRTRPDMEWVWALIKKNYDENLFKANLPVRTNPLVELQADRFILDYFLSGKVTEEKRQITSIKVNKLTTAILIHAKRTQPINTLLEILLQDIPNLNKEKTIAVIIELMEKQFLLPALIPSNLNFSLSNLNFDGLESILEQIQAYDLLPIGAGEKSFLSIKENMQKIVDASSYLQVDLAYKNASITLSKTVAKEASNALEFLWLIYSNIKKKNAVSSYHALFMERYGVDRLVPLVELLNQEKGLGSFENNPLAKDKTQDSPFQMLWERWIFQKIQECINKGEHEINLDIKIVQKLLKLSEQSLADKSEALPSCDLFFKILALSQEDIDNSNFDLAISYISCEAGSSLGRFLDLLSEQEEQNLRSFFEEEERLEPQARFVEISYWPREARCANVSINPCLRKYTIDLQKDSSDDNTIELEDIYVGATPDHLYLTNKDGEFEILTRTCNLLAQRVAPEPIRFMREVTQERHKKISNHLFSEEADKLIYIPRIRYHKTILFPQTWKIDGLNFKDLSKEEAIEKFHIWANQWKLPTEVIFAQGDNQLLINRFQETFVKKIVLRLIKGETITLTENLSSAWVKKGNANHVSEFVVPFIRNKFYVGKKSPAQKSAFEDISGKERWSVPGEKWLYLKLYLGKNKVNHFLLEHLSQHLKHIEYPWFFVRYQDPLYHLRVRIKSDHLSLKTLEDFHDKFRVWMEIGLIQKVEICPYEREIERYGGISLIDQAEEIFCADTASVVYILRNFAKDKTLTDPIVVYVLSAIYFLKRFQLNQNQILTILKQGISDKKFLAGYREYKSILRTHVMAIDKNEISSDIHFIFQQGQTLSNKAQENFLHATENLPKDKLTRIMNSLLHMHFNRIGADRQTEEQARLFAHKALHELSYITQEALVRV